MRSISANPRSLEQLLQHSTVRIGSPQAGGTGFFVAPGLILTCAHVVADEHSQNANVDVWWRDEHSACSIVSFHAGPYPDLALLNSRRRSPVCVVGRRRRN